MMGRRFENNTSEVIKYEPNRKFAIKATSVNLPSAHQPG